MTLKSCDLWDIWSKWWGNMTPPKCWQFWQFMKILKMLTKFENVDNFWKFWLFSTILTIDYFDNFRFFWQLKRLPKCFSPKADFSLFTLLSSRFETIDSTSIKPSMKVRNNCQYFNQCLSVFWSVSQMSQVQNCQICP